MANIFSRIGSGIGRLFGRRDRQDIEAAEYARQQALRTAEQSRANAQRAAQLQEDERGRARAAKARVGEAERHKARSHSRGEKEAAERERQRAVREEQDAIAKEARYRQERLRQERLANDARLKAEAARVREEQLRAKAREALLRTRKNMSDEDFARSFRGPRPAKREYENVKTGEGDLPDKEAFLKLGVRYSAFASSNVEAIVFDPRLGDLYVQYTKKLIWYRYKGVGVKVADLAYQAASKGVFTHDTLRIRGTRKGNRYPTEKNVPPPEYLPIDENSSGMLFGAHGGF